MVELSITADAAREPVPMSEATTTPKPPSTTTEFVITADAELTTCTPIKQSSKYELLIDAATVFGEPTTFTPTVASAMTLWSTDITLDRTSSADPKLRMKQFRTRASSTLMTRTPELPTPGPMRTRL